MPTPKELWKALALAVLMVALGVLVLIVGQWLVEFLT